MKKLLIAVVICCHLGAFLWSCYQEESLYFQEKKLQFISANISQEKTGNYHLTWLSSAKATSIEIYQSPFLQSFNRNGQLLNTDQVSVEFDKKSIEPTSKYLHLIIPKQDTIAIPIKKHRKLRK